MTLTPEKEESLAAFIKTRMSPYRFSHTMSVVCECRELLRYYRAPRNTLIISAYLHDVTKEMPTPEQLALCEEAGIEISPDTLRSEKTLHAESAPAFIKKYLPEFYTEETAEIIRSHTTGIPDMTIGQKLLFLADFIEPTRHFDDCVNVRRYFYSKENKDIRHLNETILYALRLTIKELAVSKCFIHGMTIQAYNYLVITENMK